MVRRTPSPSSRDQALAALESWEPVNRFQRFSKTMALNMYKSDQFTRLFPKLSADAQDSTVESELPPLPPRNPNVTIIELDEKGTTQSLYSPTSKTADLSSPSDVDVETSSVHTPSVASDSSSGTSSSTNNRSSFTLGRKSPSSLPLVPATEGASITSRCRLGEASIEGNFASVQYGTYNGRPACCMVIDFRLVFQPSSTIDWAKLQFRFGSSNTEANETQISNVFFPVELTGQCDTSQDIKGVSSNVGVGSPGAKAGVAMSKQQARITKRRWRLQGTTEEHGGDYDTFCWKIFENSLSEDSVPRNFRTGMIAYLPSGYNLGTEHDVDFWVDISIEASLRGLFPRRKKVKQRRALDSGLLPLDCNHVFDDAMLKKMVHDGNRTIPDLDPAEKMAEASHGSHQTPAPPTLPVPSAPPAPPALPALPFAAALGVDVPKKSDFKETSSQTNATSNGSGNSYERQEVDEDLLQMPANDDDGFWMPVTSEGRAPNTACLLDL